MDTDLSKLKLCSFEEFCNMEEDERTLYQSIGALLPYDDNGLGDAMLWEWGRVKESMWVLSQQNIGYYQMVQSIAIVMVQSDRVEKKIAELFKEKWVNVWKLYNFVLLELKKIAELESNTLSYESEDEATDQALSRLNKYGYFATLASLTNDDLTKFEEWKRIPYREVYSLLRLKKEREEVNKILMKIRR